jgi:tRNA threonylcarbamoyladenosine biosynthesis protein TsaB
LPEAPVIHDTQQDYSSWLLPAIERVLSLAGSGLYGVEAIAVATGPGSFTGLRVGLTTVKGLAEICGSCIVPVTRLEAISNQRSFDRDWIASLVDAGRDEFYGGLYHLENGVPAPHGEQCVLPLGEFAELVGREVPGGGVLWLSPDASRITVQPVWQERQRRGDVMEEVSSVLAPAIGRIGYARVLEGKTVDALSLDANYVRRSDAERFWKGARSHGHAR